MITIHDHFGGVKIVTSLVWICAQDARYTIWQYMARYSEIWQEMAMQYCKATALISRMEASHEITKLTDRALSVLEPRFHIWLAEDSSTKLYIFSLKNNQFYFSSIFAWTIKWQKYSMWSTWSCWWPCQCIQEQWQSMCSILRPRVGILHPPPCQRDPVDPKYLGEVV